VTAPKCSPPIPLHVTPPPDSDARREAHIREAVAKIPAPPFASSDRVLLEHVANRIYAIEIDLVHIRVGNQRAEDHNQSAYVLLAGRIDDLDSTIAGLGRHVEQSDSVSNEVQLEQAAKIDSARRAAAEAQADASQAKAVAVEAKTVAATIMGIIPESTWAKGGKVTATITALAAAVEGIARVVGIDGLTGLAGKIFGGH